MTGSEEWTQEEIRSIIEMLGTELRMKDISEAYFRHRAAALGYNATDIDHLVNEAMKPT